MQKLGASVTLFKYREGKQNHFNNSLQSSLPFLRGEMQTSKPLDKI